MRQTPTTRAIYESIEADLKSKLDINNDQLKKVLNAFAGVTAAQIKLLYLYLIDIQNNVFPDTADLEENGGQLERIGRIYLNRNPRPASAGIYRIQLNGEANSVIRSDLTFKSNEDSNSPGQIYIADSEYVLNGSDDFIELRSIEGGKDFELLIGDRLTITEPVFGIDQEVVIVEIIEEPKESESIDDYRQAVLNAIQLEPQGGARTDYRLWSNDAQGVRIVYPYVKAGEPGVVQIFVEANNEDSIDGNGTPSQSILDEVLAVIELDPDETKPLNERGRRPIQAILEILPISLIPVDVEIVGLTENNAQIQESIEINLREYLLSVRPFIDGADLNRNKNDVLFAARLQSVVTDVIDTSNFFTDFIMVVNGVVSTSNIFTGGNIPYLRNIIYS